MRAGEKIRAIDGAAVKPGNLLRLRARFISEAAGTQLKLEVESEDGARREVTLALAQLV